MGASAMRRPARDTSIRVPRDVLEKLDPARLPGESRNAAVVRVLESFTREECSISTEKCLTSSARALEELVSCCSLRCWRSSPGRRTNMHPPDVTGSENKRKKRFTLELPMPTYELLLALEEKTNATSATEVLRASIAVYDLLVNQKLKGANLAFKFPDGSEKELLLP